MWDCGSQAGTWGAAASGCDAEYCPAGFCVEFTPTLTTAQRGRLQQLSMPQQTAEAACAGSLWGAGQEGRAWGRATSGVGVQQLQQLGQPRCPSHSYVSRTGTWWCCRNQKGTVSVLLLCSSCAAVVLGADHTCAHHPDASLTSDRGVSAGMMVAWCCC